MYKIQHTATNSQLVQTVEAKTKTKEFTDIQLAMYSVALLFTFVCSLIVVSYNTQCSIMCHPIFNNQVHGQDDTAPGEYCTMCICIS